MQQSSITVPDSTGAVNGGIFIKSRRGPAELVGKPVISHALTQ
jgi:hypothetical protein